MNYTDDDIEAIVDTQIELKTRKLQQENKELRKQLDIKQDGFMASVEETCEYVTILEEFEKWLNKELKIVYRDCGHKHNTLQEVMDKLQEIKGKHYEK